MTLIIPVHSVVSDGFNTLLYGFHGVCHIVAQCHYLLMIWRDGYLAPGVGVDTRGHPRDLCSLCEKLLVAQYGWNQLAGIKWNCGLP